MIIDMRWDDHLLLLFSPFLFLFSTVTNPIVTFDISISSSISLSIHLWHSETIHDVNVELLDRLEEYVAEEVASDHVSAGLGTTTIIVSLLDCVSPSPSTTFSNWNLLQMTILNSVQPTSAAFSSSSSPETNWIPWKLSHTERGL